MATNHQAQNDRDKRASQLRFRRACALAGAALVAVAGAVHAAILEVYNDSLLTYLPSAASAVQDIRPLANQRGVNLDGSLRAGSTFGLHLNGNPLGGGGAAWSAQQRMSGVRLDIGTYDASAVDLSLPAEVPWVIGRSYNARQETSGSAARHSGGYQGNDWFQSSQPEIVYFTGATGDKDVIYLIYGADRYIELKRQGVSSTEFKTVNGAAGVMVFAAGATGQPDTFTYYDQVGTRVVFLGFDADAGAAAGQIWKVIATDGEMAYVGDATTGSTAVSAGYDGSGRILKAYDSSDRRFSYTYTSINGATRLTQVLAQTKSGGTWASPSGLATVGTVDYQYYATGATTYGDNGYLKQVVRTVPMSSGPDQVLKTYYRYDAAGHDLLTKIIEPEGVRQADWHTDNTFDDDHFTASNALLEDFESMSFAYDGSRRIGAIAMQGVCGCGGSNGLHSFDYGVDSVHYSPSAGYDSEQCTYTIVGYPDGHYALQYFDETGQTLTRVLTDAMPLSGTGCAAWISRVDRYITSGYNPGGAVQYILAPRVSTDWDNEPAPDYIYPLAGGDDEQEFLVEASGSVLDGLPTSHRFNENGSLVASTATNASPQSTTFGSTPLDAVSVTSTVDAASQTFSRTVNTWHASAAVLRPKKTTMANPLVSTGTNGSNSATSTIAYQRPDGSTAFTVDADGTWSYTQRSGGLVVKRIQDANTTGTFAGGDDPNGDFSITEVNAGLDLTTTYTYDAQGRSVTVTAPDGDVSQVHRVCLEDGQMATLSIPLISGGDYYGPVGYTITNQAGRVTASGQISFSGGDTSTAPSAWLDTGESDPIAAVDHGTLTRLTVSIYEESGTRVLESRAYHNIASPAYDATFYDYDGAGRQIAVKDPTGTITYTVFDAIGRYESTWVGTIDGVLTGGSPDLIRVSAVEYDGNSAGGNSLVTKRYAFVQGSTTGQRVTEYLHDIRDRVVVTINPQSPHSVVKYDASNRVVATGLYSSSSGLSATTNPVSTTTNRVALTETAYDELGRAYKTTRHKINQSSGASEDTLVSEMWFDADGRIAKSAGATLTKTAYDRVGRVTNRFTLASDNDSTYSDATAGVTGDTVLTEDQTYTDDYGKTLMRVSIARHYDDTSTTGALDTDANLNEIAFANVEGRVSITSYWYDARDRISDMVVLGTFGSGGGGDYDRDSYGSPHSRSATALRTTTTFNDDGTVLQTQDPEARYTRFTYDSMGRRLKTINNYVDGTAGGGANGDEDQITEAGYTSGLQTTFTAYVPGGSNQVTTYTYGVPKGASAGDSAIASGRLLYKVTYPDSASGTDLVTFAYNAQNQLIWKKDQAGNVIVTEYDTGGRTTAQRATTIISGFDTQVQAIRSAYDSLGRLSTVTQYDDPTSTSSGDVTDQVGFAYDNWGNPITFEQDFNSLISTNGDQWLVTSAWAKATGGSRTLRRTQEVIQRWKNSGGWSLIDARDVRFYYGSGGAIDDNASRVQTVREQVGGSPVDLATYRYLGNNRVVGTTYPEPSEDIVNNLHGTSSGTYPSLDNFGRVTSCTWFKDHSAGDLEFYDSDVTYDRLSQVTLVEDNVYTGRDALYTLDGLSRSIKTEEGTWSPGAPGSIGSLTRQQIWDLDSIGNWEDDQLDLNGDGVFTGTNEHDVANTFNAANEQTARNIVGGASYGLTYDAAGNMTDDGVDQEYVYDVWGRLTQVLNQSHALISQHRYNGLGYRIAWQYDLNTNGTVQTSNSNADPWMYFVYDSSWRTVASVFAVDNGGGVESGEYLAKADNDPRELFVFHTAGASGRGTSSKLDDVILRDRDANVGNWGVAGDAACEERTYYAQNWRGDVVATLDSTGGRRETIRYSTYGVPFGMHASDVNGDGVVNSGDFNTIAGANGKSYGQVGYNIRVDVNLDGTVDSTDSGIVSAEFGYSLGHNALSRSPRLANGTGNRIGYAGYAWEPSASKYQVRHRVFDPLRGRWNRRDPVGYIDSSTLYAYVNGRAMSLMDSSGLAFKKICPKFSPMPANGDFLAPGEIDRGCFFPDIPHPPSDDVWCQVNVCSQHSNYGQVACRGTKPVACVCHANLRKHFLPGMEDPWWDSVVGECVRQEEEENLKVSTCENCPQQEFHKPCPKPGLQGIDFLKNERDAHLKSGMCMSLIDCEGTMGCPVYKMCMSKYLSCLADIFQHAIDTGRWPNDSYEQAVAQCGADAVTCGLPAN